MPNFTTAFSTPTTEVLFLFATLNKFHDGIRRIHTDSQNTSDRPIRSGQIRMYDPIPPSWVIIVLIRYCDDQFDSESSTATIGVDFKVGFIFSFSLPLFPWDIHVYTKE
ncbi:hypothetical protein DSL72_007707 [Monilinia vaccinii-corymbosi]|uniref:Uncharacterized protein n=1 Tax=Monilinia vaccinii-corymbosi TaxID=61207 RepID=A0A8A3PHW6_9HELO|nr:hypothetical protein DSL72_007707 [Monilinia vaccinii-corymbosi]